MVIVVYILVIHKVENYDEWKKVFDSAFEFRKSKGEASYKLYRTADDPNNVIGIFGWDNLENAKKFSESENLKETMQRACVVGKPDFYFSD